jgi:hypothetical protein
MAANRNGGMSITPILIPKKVVPQSTQITASAVYASQEFLTVVFGFMMQICSYEREYNSFSYFYFDHISSIVPNKKAIPLEMASVFSFLSLEIEQQVDISAEVVQADTDRL